MLNETQIFPINGFLPVQIRVAKQRDHHHRRVPALRHVKQNHWHGGVSRPAVALLPRPAVKRRKRPTFSCGTSRRAGLNLRALGKVAPAEATRKKTSRLAPSRPAIQASLSLSPLLVVPRSSVSARKVKILYAATAARNKRLWRFPGRLLPPSLDRFPGWLTHLLFPLCFAWCAPLHQCCQRQPGVRHLTVGNPTEPAAAVMGCVLRGNW